MLTIFKAMKYFTELFSAFCIALTFLTRIPLPNAWLKYDNSQLRSLATQFYPLVGLLIGCLLFLFAISLHNYFIAINPLLKAVLLLMVWVGVTGALHLDGFADCVDANGAAHAAPEKIIGVMKDPHIGTMAVVATVVILLLKTALLVQVFTSEIWIVLCGAPLVARYIGVVYMRSVEYVSANGLASGIRVANYDVSLMLQGLGIVLLLYWLTDFFSVLWVVVGLLLCFMYWRRLWLHRIKGYTGDCVGALIEIVEVLFLLLIVFMK